MSRLQRWWWKRQEDRLWSKHAKWVADAVSLIGETNPTLASLTWQKARAAVVFEPPPETVREGHDRLDAALAVVMDALAFEDRRLSRGDV